MSNKVMNEIQDIVFNRLLLKKERPKQLELHGTSDMILELIREYSDYFRPAHQRSLALHKIHLAGVELDLIYNPFITDNSWRLHEEEIIYRVPDSHGDINLYFHRMEHDINLMNLDYKGIAKKYRYNSVYHASHIDEVLHFSKKLVASRIPFKLFSYNKEVTIAIEDDYMTQYYYIDGVTDYAIEKVITFTKKIIYEKIDDIWKKYASIKHAPITWDIRHDDTVDAMSYAIHSMRNLKNR